MNPGFAIMFGLSLAMDALAVSIGMVICSSLTVSATSVVRVAGTFGLFQALMPLAGWGLAERSISVINGFDHWIAFGLLVLVGGRMIFEGTRNGEECVFTNDTSRGMPLVLLALGTSIDALAAGVGFIPLGLEPFFTSSVIGFVTFIVVAAGMLLAGRIGRRSGERTAIIGGLILIILGLKILFTHLNG